MKKKKHELVKFPTLAQTRKINKYYTKAPGADSEYDGGGPNREAMKLESLWLSEASRRVPGTVTAASDNNDIAQRKRRVKKVRKKTNIYAAENQRLKGMMKQQKQMAYCKQYEPFRPIDRLLEIERRNTMAATIIQQYYRSYLRRQFWKLYFIKMAAATKIQRIVRGVLCRKLVRQWFRQRDFLANKIQAFVRGCMTRMILRTQFAWETRNAILMQSAIRQFLAKKQTRIIRQGVAALKIQSLWRGCVDRGIVNGWRLNRKALTIQSCYRQWLARRYYRKLEKEYRISATLIQKTFRGLLARARVRQVLIRRERENTQTVLDTLQAEEEWCQEHRVRLAKRLERLKFPEQIEKLEKTLRKKRDQVYELELAYLDLQKQKDRASPRAISQGWLTDVKENIKKFRKQITAKKLEALFDVTLDLRLKSEKLAEKRKEIERVEFRCQQLQDWRTQEMLDLWAREAEQGWGKKRERQARAIAEQRRRWRVKFYTSEGKPDLRRRDGYPWDPSVYAGPERDAATATQLNDILAFCNGESETEFGGKMGSLLSQLQLVNATAQKHQSETTLVHPLLDVVQKTYDTIQDRHGHVNTVEELRVNRAEIQQTKRLKDTLTDLETELKAKAEELTKVKAEAEFVEKPDQRKKAHVPWELLDQLEAEKKKLKAEKALKLLFNR